MDWHKCSQPVDFAGITSKAPNQRQCTIVDPSIIPFFLDSGASVHISNTKSDFVACTQFPLTLSVALVVPPSRRSMLALCIWSCPRVLITLNHVLFIPTVTVHLIFVSSLCSMHCCVASFDASNCWVTECSGSHMLSGAFTSC